MASQVDPIFTAGRIKQKKKKMEGERELHSEQTYWELCICYCLVHRSNIDAFDIKLNFDAKNFVESKLCTSLFNAGY